MDFHNWKKTDVWNLNYKSYKRLEIALNVTFDHN